MKKNFRRLTSVLLAVVLVTSVFSILPVQAASDETQSVGASSGTTGDCTWSLDDEGTLTISGSGAMADYDFMGCPWSSFITSLIIEDGVTKIGNKAFWGCENLMNVTIPKSVTIIGNWSFKDCFELNGIIIPENVTSIGEEAFYRCTGLTNIAIPDSVTSIGNSAFCGCTGLTNIKISESMSSIGDSVFAGCNGLTSVTIPKNVTDISGSAFSSCDNLRNITITNSKTNIGSEAFGYCFNFIDFKYEKVDGVTIYGYAYSTAEKYAYENGFNFIEMENTDEQNYAIGNYYLAGTIGGKDCGKNNVKSALEFSLNEDEECYNLNDVYLKEGDKIYIVRYLGNSQFVEAMKEADIYDTSIYSFTFKPYELGDPSYRYLSYSYSIYDPETSSTHFIVGALYEDRTSSVIGDLNGDNSVDVLDATVVQKYSVGKENLSEDQLEVADVNNDNNVDILDATEIQKFAVGKITEFKKS